MHTEQVLDQQTALHRIEKHCDKFLFILLILLVPVFIQDMKSMEHKHTLSAQRRLIITDKNVS